jgi:hypothetical protein
MGRAAHRHALPRAGRVPRRALRAARGRGGARRGARRRGHGPDLRARAGDRRRHLPGQPGALPRRAPCSGFAACAAVWLRAVGPDVAACTSVQHARHPRACASQDGLPLRCRRAHRAPACLRNTPAAMRLAALPRQAGSRAAQGGRSLSATCRTTRRACWCSRPASARCSSPPPTPCAALAAWTRRAWMSGRCRQRAYLHRHDVLHDLSLETGKERL